MNVDMKIKKLTITNFKGIDSINFEPKTINLIVGRNNTSKTSILQAIDLLFNTDKLRSYRKNFSGLIKVNSDSSEVIAELTKGKSTFKIERPDLKTTFIEFKKELEKRVMSDHLLSMGLKKKDITTEANEALNRTLDDFIDDKILTDLSKEGIILIKGDKKEPYFWFGSEKNNRLLNKLLNKTLTWIREKHPNKQLGREGSWVLDSVMMKTVIKHNEVDVLHPAVIFISGLKLEDTGMRDEDAVIKIHEIEKYIKKYNLVKNLEEFNFDYLLFKDDAGEIYPIPYEFMGDGFKAIVGLLWHLLSEKTKNKIVLIEEPENHMHPGYIRELVSYMIKFSKDLKLTIKP